MAVDMIDYIGVKCQNLTNGGLKNQIGLSGNLFKGQSGTGKSIIFEKIVEEIPNVHPQVIAVYYDIGGRGREKLTY